MVARSWDDVKTFDDLVIPEVGRFSNKVEREATDRCPHIKKKGEAFFYCGRGVHSDQSNQPSLTHPAYLNQQDTASLQLWCFGTYETCHKMLDSIA